jgi:2'-5' RNA ligase
MRVLAPETLHLTLCFLGARPVGEIDAIGATLGSFTGRIGELHVGAPVWLPPRRPRALAVEVKDADEELAALASGVSRAIAAAIDWEPERRRFRAHVTLARLGSHTRLGPRGGEPGLPATPQLWFTPAATVLYRSWLSPAGARYEPLVRSALEPPAR